MASNEVHVSLWSQIRETRRTFRFYEKILQIARFNNTVGEHAMIVFKHLVAESHIESDIKSLSDTVRHNLVTYPDQADQFAEMLTVLNKMKF